MHRSGWGGARQEWSRRSSFLRVITLRSCVQVVRNVFGTCAHRTRNREGGGVPRTVGPRIYLDRVSVGKGIWQWSKGPKSAHGSDATKGAITDVTSIVSGRNYV